MNLRRAVGLATLFFLLSMPAASAQSQDAAGQTGSAASGTSSQGMQPVEESPAQREAPDSRSFQGTEMLSSGSSANMRSYFLPSLSISEMADTNYQVGPANHQFVMTHSIMGRLTFGRFTRHTKISADYFGGAAFYTHRATSNSTMHQLGINGSYTGRRWTFSLDDRATYLPESGLGYGGFGFTEGLGFGLGGTYSSNLGQLNSVYNTSGALLTGRADRILNTSVVQVQYAISPQSSLSVGGSYSILHFRSPGFVNTNSSTLTTAYSHALNARDFVGVNYGFSWYQLQSSVPAFQTHYIQASYGHKISGRLALQLGAGPMIRRFTSPLTGPTSQTSWMSTASLDYHATRETIGLSYSHFTTGGGGVLLGAQTDRLQAEWGIPFARKWQLSLRPGYSHNRSLPQTTAGNLVSTFNAFYGAGSISRSLGRHTTAFITYNYQSQRSETTPCLVTNCEASTARHIVGLGFNFHPRQISFD